MVALISTGTKPKRRFRSTIGMYSPRISNKPITNGGALGRMRTGLHPRTSRTSRIGMPYSSSSKTKLRNSRCIMLVPH
ncbi:Uncharacterised protein [Vibrio cholerae]|uniref:Uncharacterized protein n=1 Tax=Vibrio cholerae TaxID=666 RepID=A0A655Q0R5_VIBCL|nr:Uncharacterised protein [Vibrio cholerae]